MFHESNIQEFNYFALENLFLNLFEVLGLFDALFLKLVFFELLDLLMPFLDESSLVFNLDSNSTNVVQNRSSQQSLNYNLIFRTTGANWKNSTQTSNSSTINFYDAALFNQPAASQSMAIYSRAQGYDAGSLTGTSEAFSGEDFRIKLNNTGAEVEKKVNVP